MNYEFPIIQTIHDVLPAIEGCESFKVVEKEDYTVINYFMMSNDTFPPLASSPHSAIRRECRGLIFDKSGKLIRRAYHKFFNLNEREETIDIDLSKPHTIFEKIDGSMVTPLWVNGNLRLATKMGITSVAMQAEEFIATRQNYKDFMWNCEQINITPIFEWCSPRSIVVIPHQNESLVLTGMRDKTMGTYTSKSDMTSIMMKWEIPLVTIMAGYTNYLDSLHLESGTEGVVVRFDDGHMVKLKTDWYVAIHRAKDNLLHENRVIELILNEKVDDVLPFLMDADRKKLEKYSNAFSSGLLNTITLIRDHYLPKAKDMSRKEFALTLAKELPPGYSTVMFKALDGKPVDEAVIEIVTKALTSQKRIDMSRDLWGGAIWNYYGVVE